MWRLLVRSCSSSSSRQHKQQQQRLAAAVGSRCYTIGGTTEGGSQKKHEELQARLPPFVPKPEPVTIVHKQGMELLHDPWYNKGTAFPHSERERMGVRGLLPPRTTTLQLQEDRIMAAYKHGVVLVKPEDVATGGVTSEMARKWKVLQDLQNRNETLFYKLLLDNFAEMAPIIYTPTVGWVCSNYHNLYRRPRGMFFSSYDKDHMAAMVYNWPQDDVHAIVVTDGSRILGLGDLGINGMGIPCGKLDLYSAAAGFHPSKVLPCVIDVGTNNAALRADPLYCGLDQPRITGPAYYELVDEFVNAVMARWPNAVLQFEDFQMAHALTLLQRYRDHHLVFNDDIQGTAAVALAGLYGALRVLGKPQEALAEQRIVCVGAGSAGMGVVRQIAAGMVKRGGLTPEAAASKFWVLDAQGLVTQYRPGLPGYVSRFARPTSCSVAEEGDGLLDVVRKVQPTVLLGLAGAGKLFTTGVLSAMGQHCERPIIFPMSNPTSKMECTSQEAISVTGGRCVFASGSPQPSVELDGKTYVAGQANNLYIFPGLALGAHIGKTKIVTDNMLMAAAEILPQLISDKDVAAGLVYPSLEDIRLLSAEIAAAVIKTAAADGHVCDEAAAAVAAGHVQLLDWVRGHMFTPTYSSLAYLPPGIKE
ncbi:hypothetical protein OEZ86_011350 [Tetradesmus obliquus]|nr:hypothetical protein OEZ86_011350 [Tetradesmus obliquus]